MMMMMMHLVFYSSFNIIQVVLGRRRADFERLYAIKRRNDMNQLQLFIKLKDWMSNSVDPDEAAPYEPPHLDLGCLRKAYYYRLKQWKVCATPYPSFV